MAFVDTTWYVKDNGSTGWSAVSAWAGSHSYTAGTFVRQSATPTAGNERCFVCIVAGTSGGSEPAWTVTRGAKTTDNTVTWQECTGVPGPCGDSSNQPNWNTVKNTAVTLGQVIQNVAGTTYFICTTAGTAGNGSEPSWNTSAGATTTDNSITWTSIGAISGFTAAYGNPHARLENALATNWAAAGNTIYISNNHAQTQGSGQININNTTSTSAKPIPMLCVDDSVVPPTTLATGASITQTAAAAIAITGGFLYWYGITLKTNINSSAGSVNVGSSGVAHNHIFDTCTFQMLGNGGSAVGLGQASGALNGYGCFCVGCTFLFGSTNQKILLQSDVVGIINCTFATSGSVPSTLFATATTGPFYATIRDCDLSKITGNLFNGSSSTTGQVLIENCELAGGVTIVTGSFAGLNTAWLRLHNCDSGNTNYHFYDANYSGTLQQETTITRSGGASDGTTAMSWNITTSANTSFAMPFCVPEEIVVWNDNSGSSKTATVYLASNSSLNNNDVWVELEYPGASGYPLGVTSTTRMAWLGTPAALSSDSSTWNSAPTNKYKIAVSFTPRAKGPVKARLYAAKASTTVYLDPLIVIS